jgi:hypothetical protein
MRKLQMRTAKLSKETQFFKLSSSNSIMTRLKILLMRERKSSCLVFRLIQYKIILIQLFRMMLNSNLFKTI